MSCRKYAFFDLDGTLTDPAEGITKSVEFALQKFDIFIDDRTTLHRFIGPPLADSFREFYGFSDERAVQAVEYYREYFAEWGIYENIVYDGVEDMLRALCNNDIRVVLVTSKPEVFANRILAHFGLLRYFYFVAGSQLDGSRVQKSEVIEHAIARCKIKDRAQVVMIGDRRFDIEGAQLAGIESIGVLYGYGSEQELREAGAGRLVESVESLSRALLK